jgi:hypothetical protein
MDWFVFDSLSIEGEPICLHQRFPCALPKSALWTWVHFQNITTGLAVYNATFPVVGLQQQSEVFGTCIGPA